MNEIDSKNLAPMVFFPMLRNAVSEKEQRGSRVICVLAQGAASEGHRWTCVVETTTTASLALMAGDDESNCYEVYRLRRDSRVVRVSGLQVQKVNTCHPSFLSFLC